MEGKLTIAQFGCGYWGPNLLRNFSAQPDCRVQYVIDASEERRKFIHANYPMVSALENTEVALQDSTVDAVVIATPAGTHFELARKSLMAGKHVFVEKPLATKVSEVDELAGIAAGQNLTVMVGH